MAFPYRVLVDDRGRSWLDIDGHDPIRSVDVQGRPAWLAADLAALAGFTAGERSVRFVVQVARRDEFDPEEHYGWQHVEEARRLALFESGVDVLFLSARSPLGRAVRDAVCERLRREPVAEVLGRVLSNVQTRYVKFS